MLLYKNYVYNFRNQNDEEYNNRTTSLLNAKSIWTPQFTKNKEFEDLARNLANMTFYNKNNNDNIRNLRKDLTELISLTYHTKIIIKKTDKGSIITIMSRENYWNMCQKHLANSAKMQYNPILMKRCNITRRMLKPLLLHLKLLRKG